MPSIQELRDENFFVRDGVVGNARLLEYHDGTHGADQLLPHQRGLSVSEPGCNGGTYGYDKREACIDNQENHSPMSCAIGFLVEPEPSTFEAVVFGLIGVFIFRLGFYRDNEWLCVSGGIAIFLATVAFVIGVSRIIITHI